MLAVFASKQGDRVHPDGLVVGAGVRQDEQPRLFVGLLDLVGEST